MPKFNRTEFANTGGFLRYEMEFEPASDDLASQAAVVQRVSPAKIGIALRTKRVFDIVVACLALAVSAPLLVAFAIAIKMDSRGPVFFAQERIGLNRRRTERRNRRLAVTSDSRTNADRRKSINPGRPFRIFKFRTMVADAERFGPRLASENDPRVTRVGRLMRRTRIDEIPQFLNVIRGDMSIIGPRPERPFFINEVRHEVPEFTMRLMVKPGITGLAQVENGYTKTIDEMKRKLFYDLKYIADLSLMQEIKILFKTFYVVVTGKGAC